MRQCCRRMRVNSSSGQGQLVESRANTDGLILSVDLSLKEGVNYASMASLTISDWSTGRCRSVVVHARGCADAVLMQRM
jgi:hypothetical protein